LKTRPSRISRFFSGEQILSLEEHFEGMLGLSVPSATMIEKMKETVIGLAYMGGVIFVGRAAHLITSRFPRAVHIRVIGSFDRRVERVAEDKQCTRDQAAKEVRAIDHQRRHFVSTYFHSNLDDMERYDLVFNTDRVSVEEGARLISHLVSAPDFRQEGAIKLRELRHLVLG
jgi:cytidylate kinase